MLELMKKLEEVNEILKGNFSDENNRVYWQKKRAELEQRIKTAKSNEHYYKKNAAYNR